MLDPKKEYNYTWHFPGGDKHTEAISGDWYYILATDDRRERDRLRIHSDDMVSFADLSGYADSFSSNPAGNLLAEDILAELSEREQMAVLLKRQGYSTREIGQRMGCDQKQVVRYLGYVRKKLKRFLN
jgi:RNA polymerase sigma factor (sigma-70 family)